MLALPNGDANVHLKSRVGTRIQQLREAAGLTQQQLAAGCGIDPATLSKVETGKRNMTLESLQFVMAALGVAPRDFFAADEFAPLLASTGGVAAPGESDALSLVQDGKDLHASFPCGVFEGSVRLPHMNRERVIEAILKLRAGLHQAELAQSSGEPAARTLMSKAIAESFLSLVRHSTKTNPSDVWRYLIYRAFLDPLNHPASSSGKNFDQSWKRTSGWALEQILAMNYGDFLKSRNILITS